MTGVATLNAKVAAAALLLGAIALHGLNQLATDLIPLRLAAMGGLILGAWAFSDEMGLRKPLNRAAFISFMFSMAALGVGVLESSETLGRYYLVYAFALLFAMLIWSAAFLHRQADIKLMGAVGAAASILPLVVLIAGHVSIATGAYFGVSALFQAGSGVDLLSSTPIRAIEALFILWSAMTAFFLWSGRIPASYLSH